MTLMRYRRVITNRKFFLKIILFQVQLFLILLETKIKKKNPALFSKLKKKKQKTNPETTVNHQHLKFNNLDFNLGVFYLLICLFVFTSILMWQKTPFFVNSSNILQGKAIIIVVIIII